VQPREVKHARVCGRSGEGTWIVVQRASARDTVGRVAAGAPIVCKIAVKTTPSIALLQSTVDLAQGEAAEIEIKGRHDPAIPPRIVPVAEVMVALMLADHLLRQRAASV
jgi:chorismate synthase